MALFKVTNVWGFVGGTLVLVALYLLLTNASGAEGIFSALGSSYSEILRVLQARG